MLKNPPTISVLAVVALIATAALTLFSLNYPLLSSLGPESGLLFGAVIGPLMYLGGAIRGAYRDERGFGADVRHELAVAGVLLALFCAALVINSLFVTSCAPARGALPFAAHAVPVVAFNIACGLVIGRMAGNRIFACVCALLVAALYAVGRVFLWWQNPSFRFLSHPFIALDGDLLEGAGLGAEIVGYRVATLLFALALFLLGSLLFGSSQRSGFSERQSPVGALAPVFVLIAIGCSLHVATTNVLEPSRHDRLTELSRELRRGPLVLHSDPGHTSNEAAEAVLAEASLWAVRLRERMGNVLVSDVHIWLYKDVETLARFTGAAHVHFALPAHREIHVVGSEVPHTTLGHELAHVAIGEKTSTVVGVPGVLSSIPNQGLTEGLAMMLTPELSIKAELTLQEQAAALVQSGRAFDIDALFSVSPLSFFSANTSMSYSVAGAYLEALAAVKGRATIVEVLASCGTLSAAFESAQERKTFDENFTASLKTMPLPSDAIASVSAMFAKAPVLTSTCVDTEMKKEVLTDKPLALAQRYESEAAQMGASELARKQITLDKAADAYWRADKTKEAAALWRQVQPTLLPPSLARSSEAKALFAANVQNTLQRRALDYLIYNDDDPKARAAALMLGGELAKRDTDAENATPSAVELMASYLNLRMRVLANGNNQDIAAFERLANQKLLPPGFQIESMRVIAQVRALGSKPLMAVDQFRNLASLNSRRSFSLQMQDFAQRAELIAAAQGVDEGDLNKGDIWLLGTRRFDQ